MKKILSVAVFLGSAGPSEERLNFAYNLGKELALRGFNVIFGGAEVGTMKAFADGVIDNGGDITGVFPKGFKGKREVAAVLENILIPLSCLSGTQLSFRHPPLSVVHLSS